MEDPAQGQGPGAARGHARRHAGHGDRRRPARAREPTTTWLALAPAPASAVRRSPSLDALDRRVLARRVAGRRATLIEELARLQPARGARAPDAARRALPRESRRARLPRRAARDVGVRRRNAPRDAAASSCASATLHGLRPRTAIRRATAPPAPRSRYAQETQPAARATCARIALDASGQDCLLDRRGDAAQPRARRRRARRRPRGHAAAVLDRTARPRWARACCATGCCAPLTDAARIRRRTTRRGARLRTTGCASCATAAERASRDLERLAARVALGARRRRATSPRCATVARGDCPRVRTRARADRARRCAKRLVGRAGRLRRRCATLLEPRRSSTSRRAGRATAASSAPASTPSSTSCARSPATASAHIAGDRGARARAHRHRARSRSATTASSATTSRSPRRTWRRVPADYIRKQTLAERRALHHARAQGARGEDPRRRGAPRRARAASCSTRCCARSRRRAPRAARRSARGAGARSTRCAALAEVAHARGYVRPEVDDGRARSRSTTAATRWSSSARPRARSCPTTCARAATTRSS